MSGANAAVARGPHALLDFVAVHLATLGDDVRSAERTGKKGGEGL